MASKKPTYEELKDRVKALKKEAVTFKGADEKIEHLNRILSAIRNVRRLIHRERDRDRLLKGVCDNFVSTRGYFNAWIALLDKTGGLITTSESGLGKDFLPMIDYIKNGQLTNCARNALRLSELVVIEDPLSTCTDCPLAHRYAGRGGMTVPLEYDGNVYGLLSCSISCDFTLDEQSKALFKEVADDISYALYRLELDKKRNQFEETLRESEAQKKAILDASVDRIRLVDKGMRIAWANKTTTRELNVAAEDLVGHRCYEVFVGRDTPCPGCPTEKALESGQIEHSVLHRTKSKTIQGETYWDGYAVPVKNESGDIVSILQIARNITKQKHAEEEKRRLEAQILQSEKMASIGQLAAGVAHEINNPTGFVSSNLKTLADYQKDIFSLIKEYRELFNELKETGTKLAYPDSISDEIRRIRALESEVDIDFIMDDTPDLIKDCQEGSERIKKIVLDLKGFAHPGEQKLKYADINKGLDSTLNVVWNELKYKATVTKDYGDLPEVRCYPQQLNQVFANLLVNAAQAIEKEGEIRIMTRALDGQVEISISDTGVGIPKEDLSRLFDPFFTTKEVGKGTGLGLNVAYNIIQKHKGTVDVESEVGKGTTFMIRIPVG
jgi:PAS domain S-box-containing protein